MIAKTTTALAALALAVAATLPAKANTADCLPIDEAKAKGLFEKWAGALPGHNPDLVLAFYAPGHSFKPHDAEAAMTDAKAVRDYWQAFVDKTPTAALKDAKVETACNSFTKTGTKVLKVDGSEIEANFTMAMEAKDGTWLITRHEITPIAQ